MSALEIILLPFALIYRGFITLLMLPYYIVLLFIKLFDMIAHPDSNNKKVKTKGDKVIAEAKSKNEKIVVREKRVAYDNSKMPIEKKDFGKDKDALKKQKLYEKYVKKAREDELKRIQQIEKTKEKTAEAEKQRIAKELAKDEVEQKKLVEAQKKLEEAKKAGKVPFNIKFKEWFKKINTPANQDIELAARQTVLKEGFHEQIKKDPNLKPMMFTYVARNKNGELEKSEIEALTRIDVQSFLENEGYEIYDISPTNTFLNSTTGSKKMKKARLIFYLSQLSAYIKSGIVLADGVKILCDQAQKKSEKATWKSVYYDLSMGDVLSVAMEKRGNAFPKLLINMIKTAEMTGNLAETLDDMVDYYSESEATRKQMKSAMTYPVLILSFAGIVVIFILIWVVPQFKDIFDNLGADLPAITKIVLSISNFLQTKGLFILLGFIVLLVIYIYLYKTDKAFRKSMQTLTMHLPIFGNIVIYNEITIFSKTFANLINHNVFITDSIGILSKITNNEIYKKLIYDTANNLTKGESISKSFKDQWAFPNIAYQMLTTGEKTGRLGQMMERVASYYSEQHRNIINSMKTLIEPILIVSLAVVVGFILLAVIVPMFEMYNSIG